MSSNHVNNDAFALVNIDAYMATRWQHLLETISILFKNMTLGKRLLCFYIQRRTRKNDESEKLLYSDFIKIQKSITNVS